MPQIHFIAHDGLRTSLDVAAGETLLQAAVKHKVRGIDGDCGGQCACATCHVFIAAPWAELIPSPQSNEDEMLNFTAERHADSRLACQVQVSEALDGIEVRMPIGQH